MPWAKFIQYINIALGPEIISKHGAKKGKGANVVLPAKLRQPLSIDGNTYPHSYLARIAC